MQIDQKWNPNLFCAASLALSLVKYPSYPLVCLQKKSIIHSADIPISDRLVVKHGVKAARNYCFYRFLLSASFARCHSSRVTAPAPLCQVANLPNNLFHLPSPWLSGQRKLTQSVREVVVCRCFPQTVIVLTHFFIRGCWWNKKSLFSRNMYMTSGNLFWFCK